MRRAVIGNAVKSGAWGAERRAFVEILHAIASVLYDANGEIRHHAPVKSAEGQR
jgi:hypothetical protein